MNPYLVTAVLDFALCVYVLLSRSKAPKATALMSLALGMWSLELFAISYVSDIEILYPIFHLTRWGMFFIPAALSFLVHQLVKEKTHSYFKYTVIPCIVISSALSLGNTFFFPSKLLSIDGQFEIVPDHIYTIFLLELIYAAIATVIYSIKKYFSSSKRDKQRIIWWATLGLAMFGLGTGLAVFFLFLEKSYINSFFGAYLNLTYILFILYITNNKSLIDLKQSLSILISHILALSTILSIYIYAGKVSETPTLTNSNFIISCFILCPAFILYSKIVNAGIKTANKIIAKHNYNKEKTITSFKEKFRASSTIEELSNHVTILITDIIRAKKVAFYRVIENNLDIRPLATKDVSDTQPKSNPCVQYATKHHLPFFFDEVPGDVATYMKKRSLEVILPITQNEKLSSLICIGEPKSSHFFKNEDIVIFSWLQTELSNSITRIENINMMKNELNESRKTLSMLNVMNQYHHDIKTPLAVIDGIVSTGMYDKEQQREIVMEQVAKGTKLIATMANILRGNRNRETTQILLRDSIQQCLFLFDNGFEKISQDFNDTKRILGDDIDLKILFSNLLKNASEAADPKRALTLNVKTWEDQQHAYLSITDSGVGMNTETINNLWHLDRSEKETGCAIGLQAIKRIAEEHKAQISVTSTPDIGTCFELRFPIAND